MTDFLSKPERRNYRRLDIDLDVNLVIEGKTVNTMASNISCGGLFIPKPQASLKEKDDVEIILHIPDSSKPVKIFGEVARLDVGAAIRFRGLYDDNILAIDRFIKSKLH